MEKDLSAALARRRLLAMQPAPQPHHDAIVTLRRTMGETDVRLRYVPDRNTLSPEGLAEYLNAVDALAVPTMEALAQLILEDINDEVIPCWLQVTVQRNHAGLDHKVRIEERQPKWDDRGLLARVAT